MVEARNSAAAEVLGPHQGRAWNPGTAGHTPSPPAWVLHLRGAQGQATVGHGPCQPQAVLSKDSSPQPCAHPLALQ